MSDENKELENLFDSMAPISYEKVEEKKSEEDVSEINEITENTSEAATNTKTYVSGLWRSMMGEVDNRRKREIEVKVDDKKVTFDATRSYFQTGGYNVINEVTRCYLYARENSRRHHTDKFEILENEYEPPLVIRRGDNFFLAVELRYPWDASRDKMRLEFLFGPHPQLSKGTLVYALIVSEKKFSNTQKWHAKIDRVNYNQLVLTANVPASTAVGVWRLRLTSRNREYPKNIKTFKVPENVYILFNPWSSSDPVYLNSDKDRDEFVLNDVGKIYSGTHNNPEGRKWIYGQFNDVVLPAVMFLIEKSKLDYSSRANVIKVRL